MAKEEAKKEVATKPKRGKKLIKEVYSENGGGVKLTVLGGEKGEMNFPFSKYPVEIQKALGPFGQGHKLGDSAAGRSGKDAETAIIKVHEGMMANDWSVRAPAQPKVKLSEIAQNFLKMTDAEKAKAAPLLKSLGIDLPNIAA